MRLCICWGTNAWLICEFDASDDGRRGLSDKIWPSLRFHWAGQYGYVGFGGWMMLSIISAIRAICRLYSFDVIWVGEIYFRLDEGFDWSDSNVLSCELVDILFYTLLFKANGHLMNWTTFKSFIWRLVSCGLLYSMGLTVSVSNLQSANRLMWYKRYNTKAHLDPSRSIFYC